MSADPDQEYFCEGMAEELIDALAKLDGLRVVARTSSFQFKGQSPDLRDVGHKLNVRTVLEGSVRKVGDRLRVNAQLINAEDGYLLWSERYDRDMDDIFAVQDDIARTVVEKLKVKLLGISEETLVKRPTDNLEAYTLYLQGRYHQMRGTAAALEKSLECFSKAVEIEPTYAEAQAGVAMARAHRTLIGVVPPHDVLPDVKDGALKALGLDERVAEAHFALGYVFDRYEWKREDAEREYRRALQLDSHHVQARSHLAHLLVIDGRAAPAISEARTLVEQDPISAFCRWHLW